MGIGEGRGWTQDMPTTHEVLTPFCDILRLTQFTLPTTQRVNPIWVTVKQVYYFGWQFTIGRHADCHHELSHHKSTFLCSNITLFHVRLIGPGRLEEDWFCSEAWNSSHEVDICCRAGKPGQIRNIETPSEISRCLGTPSVILNFTYLTHKTFAGIISVDVRTGPCDGKFQDK